MRERVQPTSKIKIPEGFVLKRKAKGGDQVVRYHLLQNFFPKQLVINQTMRNSIMKNQSTSNRRGSVQLSIIDPQDSYIEMQQAQQIQEMRSKTPITLSRPNRRGIKISPFVESHHNDNQVFENSIRTQSQQFEIENNSSNFEELKPLFNYDKVIRDL